MKIAVFSDSHGQMEYMLRAADKEKPDAIIHLGDHITDADRLRLVFQKTPVYAVLGNCDGSLPGENKILLELEGKRILAMHGHTCHVKSGLLTAIYTAQEANADILLFGHTHVPLCDQSRGILILNPGTVGRGTLKTYGIIEIENGTAKCRTAIAE